MMENLDMFIESMGDVEPEDLSSILAKANLDVELCSAELELSNTAMEAARIAFESNQKIFIKAKMRHDFVMSIRDALIDHIKERGLLNRMGDIAK